MNIKYASAATFVSPIIVATVEPLPISTSSSVSIKLVMANVVAIVPTTFSFAIKPVIAAAASCQEAIPIIGTKRYANGIEIKASIDFNSTSDITNSSSIDINADKINLNGQTNINGVLIDVNNLLERIQTLENKVQELENKVNGSTTTEN